MVYIEPAPYIVGLVDAIRSIWEGVVEVAFVHDALTQPWNYRVGRPGERILPEGHLRAVMAVRQLLAGNDYDLLHLAGWGHPVLLGALATGSWHGLPVAVETDTPLPRTLPVWKRLIKEISYRPMFRLPAVFLPGGSRQAAYLRHYGVEEERIHIAQMTVDVTKILSFSARKRQPSEATLLESKSIPADHVKFLYVGRLEPHKGLGDLITAFEQFKEKMPGVALLIAGDGSLREWIEQRAVPPIYYLGRLSGDSVWEAYAASDIFVLPSHFEPWGLVVNEAMASGLPVIATERAGCVDDLVRHGITGLIVGAESPDQLLSAMHSLAANSNARRQMGARAKQFIADWILENAARRTVDAWRMALR